MQFFILFLQIISLGFAATIKNFDPNNSPKDLPTEVIPTGATVQYYEFNSTAETRNIDGFYRQVYLLNDQTPGPLISGTQGDWVVVKLNNYLPVPMTLHFHGIIQKTTAWSDGSAGITQYPVLSGDSFTYVFQLIDHGFFWYHSHYRGYSNDGIIGPIWSKPNDNVTRPYEEITNNTDDIKSIMNQETQPQMLLFTDLFKEPYDLVSTKMFDFGMDPTCIRSILINGKGRYVCMDNQTKYNEATNKMKALAAGLSKTSTDGFTIDEYGCQDLQALNGFTSIDYDKSLLEFPGYNYGSCKNSTTERSIFNINETWTMFNVLNMGGEFSKLLSIDDHNVTIVAVDGTFVNPISANQIYLPIGQRVTILVKTDVKEHSNVEQPFAIRIAVGDMPQILQGIAYLAYPQADNSTNIQNISDPNNGIRYQDNAGNLIDSAIYADPGKQTPYVSNPPPEGKANKTLYLYLNRLGQTSFAIYNDMPMAGGMELDKPILYSITEDSPSVRLSTNYSETIDPTIIDIGIELGDVVDIIFQNSAAADHPMHLHGHTFWHIAGNESAVTFNYSSTEEALNAGYDGFNFEDPPYVDNIALKAGGWGIIRFVADNPGIWMIHCHIQTHLSAGMAAALIEAKKDITSVPNSMLIKGHADYNSKIHNAPSELQVSIS